MTTMETQIDTAESQSTELSSREGTGLKEARLKVGRLMKAALNEPKEIVRVAKSGRRKTVVIPAIGDRQIISARELWLYCVGRGKPINWIESYKALLKYVSKDYRHIFQPIVKGDRSGTRYYVKVDNAIEFLAKFETNSLERPKKKKAVEVGLAS